MSNEDRLISALETTIETQKQLIKHLTAEIERLNLSRLIINPTQPLNPYPSPYPYYQPNNLPFTTPINPLEPPFIVKCEHSPQPPNGVTVINGYLKEALKEEG